MKVERNVAIGHALWEAKHCYEHWALCAAKAMLRKALDLWTASYCDRQEIDYLAKNGNKKPLQWRLEEIAKRNDLYRHHLHGVVEFLKDAGNDALHDEESCAVCEGSPPGRGGPLFHLQPKREHVRKNIELVERMILSTTPGVEVQYAEPKAPGPPV